MCTAISFSAKDHYFGRNLDLEYSYCETVTITPRNYCFSFHKLPSLPTHYAIIGMAYVQDNYPLYYDATNENGLSIAGLNFPGNACYFPVSDGGLPLAPYELIPYLLGKCSTVSEACSLLSEVYLADIPFSRELPLTPLHYLLSDASTSVTVEPTKKGLMVYQNPVGVLTNNPPFPIQMFQLNNYMSLSNAPISNHFSDNLSFDAYSRGMGALGLPGDYSSSSRFVKACFLKENSVCGNTESECLSQFFHLLDSVAHTRGCVELERKKYEITVYSSCCNTDKGIYYYTTYENRQITGINMHSENLDGQHLISYPLITGQQILMQNETPASLANPLI